jgi:hypothetical protein
MVAGSLCRRGVGTSSCNLRTECTHIGTSSGIGRHFPIGGSADGIVIVMGRNKVRQ